MGSNPAAQAVTPAGTQVQAPVARSSAVSLPSRGGRGFRGRGWYVTFVLLALTLFVALDYFFGLDVIAASARFLWNGLALAANSVLRTAGGLLAVLAKGVGWRRLARIGKVLAGVGLSYSAGVVLSDRGVHRARTWTGRLRAAIATSRDRWLRLHLAWKLAIVAALIASQIYLHFLFILFPIAFLVPVIRRVWVQGADILFGSWYWKAFGRWHRAAVALLRTCPGIREVIGAARLTRIRYLCAWRLWRYEPRYRNLASGKHTVSFIEPLRLWWRGELDRYVGRSLLCGPARAEQSRTRPA
jgi:hypothetical protein